MRPPVPAAALLAALLLPVSVPAGEVTVGGDGGKIASAMASAKPGDTVVVEAGTYEFPGVELKQKAKDSPITIRAEGKVHLDMKGKKKTAILFAGAEGIHVKGFEISGVNGHQNGAVVFAGAAHNVVEDCDLHDCGRQGGPGAGVYFDDCKQNTVRRCKIHDNYTGAGWFGDAVENVLEWCDIYKNNVHSENSDGVSMSHSGTQRNTVRGCLLHENADDGMDLWGSRNQTIEFCVAYKNGDGKSGDGNGYKLGSNRVGGSGGHIVRGNIAYGQRGAGFLSNGRSNVYYNNVSVGNGVGFLDLKQSGEPGSVFLNNVAVDNKHHDIASDYVKSAAYNLFGDKVEAKAKEGKFNDNAIKGDPKFKDPANGDFHVEAGSCLIDAGSALPDISDPTDRDGNKIPSGAAPDVGAYEVGGGGSGPAVASSDPPEEDPPEEKPAPEPDPAPASKGGDAPPPPKGGKPPKGTKPPPKGGEPAPAPEGGKLSVKDARSKMDQAKSEWMKAKGEKEKKAAYERYQTAKQAYQKALGGKEK